MRHTIGIGLMTVVFSCSSDPDPVQVPSSNGSEVAGGKDQGTSTTVFAARSEPAGTNCAAGGIALLSGPDKNRNGVLDAGEVTTTQYVCNATNGTDGTDGVDGTDGIDGEDGKSALAATRDVPVGSEECPAGGTAVSVGLDSDGSGTLDESEVTSTFYVCNGEQGPAGAPGSDGHSALVNASQELPGANCSNGGVHIESGLDTDDDGVLDASEVKNTFYVCDGADDGGSGVSVLANVTEVSPGTTCPLGGKQIDTGADASGDGILEPVEITHTTYLCTVERTGSAACPGGAGIQSGLDTNFNGVLDDQEVLQETLPTWYSDCDGDTFATTEAVSTQSCEQPTTAPITCEASPSATWTARAPYATTPDCWDQDADARPRTTNENLSAWKSVPIAGAPVATDFDYNCDGVEEKRYQQVGVPRNSACSLSCSAFGCFCTGNAGWETSVMPSCGGVSTYSSCDFFTCNRIINTQQAQECR